MSALPLRVFIGWDAREPEAFQVARFSLERRATIAVDVVAIDQRELRAHGLYWRDQDPLASTEFTYSRFLTPALAGFNGWALYCDCDFLWLTDVAELMGYANVTKAIYCVQHDHRPVEAKKMDGIAQSIYPRKNWSSLMLFNCGHSASQRLTPYTVNNATGAYLHRMQWVGDEDIGALPLEWNWLEGWNEKPAMGMPKAIHFTRGGPWFENWRNVDYADRWLSERDAMLQSNGNAAQPKPPG